MEEDCVCLFCQRDDLNLYEINQNSILIGSDLVDFNEIIFEIFYAQANSNVLNYICEECKDLITQFYIFKQSSRLNLVSSNVINRLKHFLSEAKDQPKPIVKATQNQFIVSFVPIDEQTVKYSVVKPIIKIKFSTVEAPEEKYVNVKYPEEVEIPETVENPEPVENLEPVELDSKFQETDSKFQETDVEEVQEEEVYTVESIMETDENEDAEHYFEEHEESDGSDVKQEDELLVELKDFPATDEVFQCECGITLPSLNELQKHMYTHKRKASGNETCCGVGFKDYKAFTIHQKAHENFEAIAPHLPAFVCNECNVMYSNLDDRNSHLELHTEGAEVISDFVIDRRGVYEDHFIRNIPRVTEPEVEDTGDLFSCGHCRKKLNEFDMKVHLLFFHTNIVFCPLDNRYFEGTKHVRLFSDHIRNKHPEIFEKNMLYSCRHCSKTFTTCFEKLAHMKLCIWKPFACTDHCNKRFATEWLLKAHMKHVNGEERFSCETCGKRCVSRSDLQIHERMHTNERPYPCPLCDKKFKTSANRSSHMDIHEPEKRHECVVCGEKFQTRPILRKHKKIHDEKYQEECICRICDRKYISKPHLLRHLKSAHGSSADLTTEGISGFFEDFSGTEKIFAKS